MQIVQSVIRPFLFFDLRQTPGVDSPPLRHWKESALVSAEDASLSRTPRASPQRQTNGHDDRTPSPSRTEEKRGSKRQTRPEHQSTGPASLASVFSGSYCSYGLVNGEYNDGQVWPREQWGPGSGSGSGSGTRPSSQHLFDMSREMEDPTSYQSPVQCNMAEGGLPSPPTAPQPSSAPAASFSYSEQNGCSSAPPYLDHGRASPLPARSSRSQKRPKAGARSDSGPKQGHGPTLSRAERMAALERRMLANGLSAPVRARSGAGGQPKRKAHAGAPHVGGLQMSDCGTTSGSESSESEAEETSGNPAESSFASSVPRSKFSFGSLQLDEEADEEGCCVFSDEEGGQIFNC